MLWIIYFLLTIPAADNLRTEGCSNQEHFLELQYSVLQTYSRYKQERASTRRPSPQKQGGRNSLWIKKDCVMIKGGSVTPVTEKEGLQPLRSGGSEKWLQNMSRDEDEGFHHLAWIFY